MCSVPPFDRASASFCHTPSPRSKYEHRQIVYETIKPIRFRWPPVFSDAFFPSKEYYHDNLTRKGWGLRKGFGVS
eukprot:scaffold157188_cov35-Tisochrysis_lutea.AAC.2